MSEPTLISTPGAGKIAPIIRTEEAKPAPTPAAEPAAPTPAAPPVQPKQDPAFLALVRRERALQAERAKLASEKEALQAKASEADTLRARLAKFRESPLDFVTEELGENGYSIISEQAISGSKTKPTDLAVVNLRNEIQAIKDEQKARDEAANKAAQDNEKKLQTETVQRFESGVIDYVKGKGDTYELINALGEQAQVNALLHEHWRRQVAAGVPDDEVKVLSVDEAAALVEKWLEERTLAAAKTKRLTGKFGSASGSGSSNPGGGQTETRTLTNELTSTPGRKLAGPRTETQRRQDALAAYDAAMAKKP